MRNNSLNDRYCHNHRVTSSNLQRFVNLYWVVQKLLPMRSLSFFAKSRTISLLVGLIILTMILPCVVSAQSISSSVVNTPPKAQFTSNTIQGQSPLTVQFFDQSTGTAPMTYHWDFSDGAGNLPENSQQNPSWKFWDNDATSFTVSLTVTNAYGTDTIVKQNFITLVDTSVDTSS